MPKDQGDSSFGLVLSNGDPASSYILGRVLVTFGTLGPLVDFIFRWCRADTKLALGGIERKGLADEREGCGAAENDRAREARRGVEMRTRGEGRGGRRKDQKGETAMQSV